MACGHCHTRGDYKVCRGCLSTPYCSQLCQMNAWVSGHKDQCSTLTLETFGDVVLDRPSIGRELSLQNSSNRYQGLYTAAKAKFEELKDTVEEMEQLREDEGEEHKATSKALKLLQKKQSGLSSSLARARNRLQKDRKEEGIDEGELVCGC